MIPDRDDIVPEGTSRRTVLKFAVAGGVIAIMGRAIEMDAKAYDLALQEGLVVLTAAEAECVQAFGARIWPGDPGDPGAREAGTVYYVDRALSGPYSQHTGTYRRAIRQLNAAANSAHGADFAYIPEDKQDEMITQLAAGRLSGVTGGQAVFNLWRTHTMEGLFADPIYGGNRNFAGWRAVGYPGPFYFISIEDQQSFEPLNMPLQSIVDL